MNTIEKAKQVTNLITSGVDITEIRAKMCDSNDEWYRISAKTHEIYLKQDEKRRNRTAKQRYISSTSVTEIQEITSLNDILANFALCLPTISTMKDFREVAALVADMPRNESHLLATIEKITMSPRMRAYQKKGRFGSFEMFKEFLPFIEAATLCYFRGNYISAYMTLVPVVEGIILRWMKYLGSGEKPNFESMRRFFSKPYDRQPCPWNPLFHRAFSKACDQIIKLHLYKHSNSGSAYSDFNRHLAVHLMNDSKFATQSNCIRLFTLIDAMAEIYFYEKRELIEDPRFNLKQEEVEAECIAYTLLSVQHSITDNLPEQQFLASY